MKFGIRFLLAVSILALVFTCGCETTEVARSDFAAYSTKAAPIRVGIGPDYPPIVFRRGKALAGVEIELAAELGKVLGRPVKFVELDFAGMFSALLEGRVDIIMSGLTVTEARKVRIAFSNPYFKTGQMALIRLGDVSKYTTKEAILKNNANFGVQKGSTADVFVNQKCLNRASLSYLEPANAGFYLVNRKIDVFIHDAPAVIWTASENESELTVVTPLLDEQELAWGVRKDDPVFQKAVNDALAAWKVDGTLDRVIRRWVPEKAGTIP